MVKVEVEVGLALEGLLQAEQFYDSVILNALKAYKQYKMSRRKKLSSEKRNCTIPNIP